MADASSYFAANPDVAAAFSQNSYGLTPDQFASTHYSLYGANEQRAAPTETPAAPVASTPSLPPPPTWTDTFNKWNVEQNLPERAAKGYTTPDMWSWNTDAEHQKVKDLLDKQYVENVRQYNAIYGTNVKPDTSVLGANAQPNTTYYSPEGGGGLFGSGIGPDVSWVNLRDNLEAAGVVAGNYLLPGSSMLTGQLVTKGAQENLNTDVGRLANIAAGATGGIQGNMANYGKIGEAAGLTGGTSSLTAEQLAAANATSDPIAAANALKGWTIADIPYLQSIGATTDLISLAEANNAKLLSPAGGGPAGGTITSSTGTSPLTNLTPAQTAQLAKAGINVAGLLAGGAAVKGIANNLTGGGGGTGGMLTQQDRSGVSSGSAQYSPEYYQAIQAKYSQMMPQQPRDVTTDLKSWYETKYAPKVTQ